MSTTALSLLLLGLLLIGVLPIYPYSRRWGYYASGVLLVILSIMILTLLA